MTAYSELVGNRRAEEHRCQAERARGATRRLPIIFVFFLVLCTAGRAQRERDGPPRVHPVVSLVESRLASYSLPGRRSDGLELCLAIEGGAMRGVVSAGMVSALEHLGLRDVFDAVYGTSAGAINGAYFLSAQAADGTTIYYENVNSSKFIARRRIVTPGRVMSLEFLLDHVMVHEKILDWQAVLDSAVPLKVVVTSMERRRAEVLDGFRSREELWESLRASARIPVIAGPPVQIDGERYLDGGVYAKIPLDLAIADLCTHVLVLQVRPEGMERPAPGPLRRWVVRRYLRKFDPELARRYGRGPSAYDDVLEAIRRSSLSGDGPPYVLGVTPEPAGSLAAFEKSRERLLGGARAGFDALVRIFGHLRPDSESPFSDPGIRGGKTPAERPRE